MSRRIPLYPFALGRDFQLGDILNGQNIPHEGPMSLCRNPYLDYSGADPDIQFPAGWHVKAGFGNLAGGFHQDMNRFEPWRVQVQKDPGKTRNLIRMQGGDGEQRGGAELAKWFDREVRWEDGKPIIAEFTLKPSSEVAVSMYFNVELRGLLSFEAKKNEPVEAFGLHFTDNFLKAKYWLDPYDGIDARERKEVKNASPLQLNRWYRLELRMTPMEPRYTWQVDAVLSVRQKPIWSLHTGPKDSPNGIDFISQVTLGDEQEKNLTGGVWYVARAMCWTE